MAVYNNDRDPNEKMWERQAITNDQKPIVDPINVQDLLNFLEYEEALTNDKESAARIRNYFKKIGLWS